MTDTDDTIERAKELFIYGPLGFALFLRDSGPQFMRLFVARGRTELQQRQRTVGDQIDQVRSLGESVAADRGPEMVRTLSTFINALREKAEETLTTISAAANGGDAVAADSRTSARAPTADGGAAGVPAVFDLAIRRYVELSAAQVVEQLDGLSAADLLDIRDYEAAHRARNTILGKIEQLTRDT